MGGLESTIKRSPTKAHTVYKLGGKRIPSVTTILGVTNYGGKYGALMGWQRKELLAGNDPQAVKGEAAKIGTLAHLMIEAHLKEKKLDTGAFSQDQIKVAKVAYRSYLKWEKIHKPETVAVEEHLTHGYYRYGGTIDYQCIIGGVPPLIDFKSSNAVYLDHRLQVAAYQQLVKHRKGFLPDTWILHLGKDIAKFGDHHYPDLSLEWEAFKLGLKAYVLNRKLGK